MTSDKKQTNPYQRALIEGYPAVDLLPFDTEDHDEIQAAVDSDETGDTLFTFLWRELSDLGEDDPQAVAETLGRAIEDIRAVQDVILAMKS